MFMLKYTVLSIPREELIDLVFNEIFQTVLYIAKSDLKLKHNSVVIISDIG